MATGQCPSCITVAGDLSGTLDTWLQSNDVVVPSAIGLDLYEEPDGSISFVPTADSLDKEEFRTVFQRNQEAHGFYTIQRSATERLRVVLSDRHKAVLQRMKRVQRVNGDRKQQLISDPIQAFDGIAGDVELPLSYSERVIGIGSFQYLPVPKSPSDEGGLLGSALEFVAQYENQGSESRSIEHLKQRLLYESPNAFMLRRSKEEVLELPAKQIHRVNCVMSSEEIEKHKALALGIGEAGLRRQKLEMLHRFARLYQHPSLMRSSGDDLSVEELKASSSKLRKLLDILHRIKRDEEKTIIFARHKDVQRMLARVLAEDFKMPIRILNGETPRISQARRGGAATRRHILDEFRSRPGFNVIVLSPFVAGVGLTIVEANHVIHYGRWWNPAVEAQATDRAYRLGQTKPVHVYLPILCDETKQVSKTFDELLDELMVRKESLARDTLAKQGFRPLSENEESAGMEIAQALSL